ncbi:MAG: hypothetical protein RLN89_04895 [Parvibaculum sp.]
MKHGKYSVVVGARDHMCVDLLFVRARRGGGPAIGFHTIARIEVEERGVTLKSGLGIGSRVTDFVSTYRGAALAEPNKYDEATTGYQVKLLETVGLVFSAWEGRVHAFCAGRYPELEWVEGCS